ncbi:unnamed protein product [Paramecium sonneborni]|uniref:Uncharacterized protein n=1 Tax=Paramecium sonneborni TaxID=65129 RepID=A0A8S1RSC4_9CILI|nr:unnamed protein product [Paramecium sonneborni]
MLIISIRLFRQFRFCSSLEDITKKQAGWSAIAKQKTQQKQIYLEQKLSQDQKLRVITVADTCCELDLFEFQCFLSLLNKNHYKAQGMDLFDIDSNWPVIEQNEVPTGPPKEKEFNFISLISQSVIKQQRKADAAPKAEEKKIMVQNQMLLIQHQNQENLKKLDNYSIQD